jgi:hypothetical protein
LRLIFFKTLELRACPLGAKDGRVLFYFRPNFGERKVKTKELNNIITFYLFYLNKFIAKKNIILNI